MCAINGICWEDSELVQKMNHATLHRGPDATKIVNLSNITFGHNRLSIIDLDSRASQPMQTPDGRYTIIYNGEIYNFKELRSLLRSSYEFKTESDTEVILAGFKEWGSEVFSRLNGMYALAIYDRDTTTVTLVRDPMGIKPLYITKTPKGYAFSSEIKALLDAGVSRELDIEAFGSYMRTLYVPAPKTLFRDVEKFPSGKIGTIKNGSLSFKSFTYKAQSSTLDAKDSSALKQAVKEAVKRQMVSDRPLGVYLSGGIDSSTVLAAATEAGGNMDTYSTGFELTNEEESARYNADSLLARRTASYFGAKHHESSISLDDMLGLFKEAVYYLDEPIGNATVAAQLALSEKARESVVVALTGDGGDEMFGGYPRHLIGRRMNALQRVIPPIILNHTYGKLKKTGVVGVEKQFELFHFQKDSELRDLLKETPSLPSMGLPQMKDLMEADQKTWLVDEALLRSDKLGMAHSLETRPPFLDLELAHQISNISFEEHVSLFDTKVLLKRAMKDVLPEWVISAPKRGWLSPGAKLLQRPTLYKEIKEILSPGYAPNTDELFNWEGVQTALEEHRKGVKHRAPALIAIVMFQLWSKRYNIHIR